MANELNLSSSLVFDLKYMILIIEGRLVKRLENIRTEKHR